MLVSDIIVHTGDQLLGSMSTFGSYTTTQLSTAKLEISLLLKPSNSEPSVNGSAEDIPQDKSHGLISLPPIGRPISGLSEESRRISESTATSVATTPTLATATTSRQPSLTAIATPDLPRASMDVAPPRPVLPPLVGTSPPPSLSQPVSLPHQTPMTYLSPHYQLPQPVPAYPPTKRQRTSSPPTQITTPAKRQSKWTPEEDALIIELRGSNMKWEDISKHLPGRSAISCRLHYQNYLERRSEWDEEKKNRLARLYERLKSEMWSNLASELGIPWRAAEAMHWQLGEAGMASRAGVTPFSLASTPAQARHSSYQPATQVQQPGHHRGHSDPPPHDSFHHSHRWQGPPSAAHDPRFYPSSMAPEKEEMYRYARPPSPVINIPLDDQSRRVLPSMAELDQGLTAAAMVDARRNSSPARR